MKPPKPMWVDTDLALGGTRGDVDDGFALAAVVRAAQKYPAKWRLRGVSVVAGNTDAATAHRCARELLAVCELDDQPLSAGDEAARAIARLPDGASILALGPLTNVAKALDIDPALPRRVEIRIVATVRDRWRHPLLGFYCLNSRTDCGALRRVMRAGFRELRIFPLDVVSRLRFGRRELDALAALLPLGRYLALHSRRWLRQAPWRHGALSFPVWDLVAALDAVDALSEACFEGERLTGLNARATFDAFFQLISLK
jgi:inosine-uridine nucleoside N-ribohydrolase